MKSVKVTDDDFTEMVEYSSFIKQSNNRNRNHKFAKKGGTNPN